MQLVCPAFSQLTELPPNNHWLTIQAAHLSSFVQQTNHNEKSTRHNALSRGKLNNISQVSALHLSRSLHVCLKCKCLYLYLNRPCTPSDLAIMQCSHLDLLSTCFYPECDGITRACHLSVSAIDYIAHDFFGIMSFAKHIMSASINLTSKFT
jgi:hypothetical protein